MNVPFNDLKLQYADIRGEIDAALRQVVAEQQFIGGEEVEAFEREFAAYSDAPVCVACASGTDALMLALAALGVGPGDDVVVPAMTFVATAEAVAHVGARPVFADVEDDRGTLDAAALERSLTPATRAAIVVHLYGQIADMEPIAALCRRRGLWLIEDAAQAHGATWQGRPAGAWGECAAYSFFPGKNLGAYGDAGALVGRNSEALRRAALLRDHGRRQKYLHDLVGYNARCDALQAAILRVKLRHLPRWTERRRAIADHYRQALTETERVRLPRVPAGSAPVWHLFTLRSPQRDALRAHLERAGIATGIHYPHAVHQQPAFAARGRTPSLPVAERIAQTTLSLPLFPELREAQMAHVVETVNSWSKA